MLAHNHKDLRVWQRAMDLVDAVYTLTQTIPNEERFGLSAQMRRCAVSIPANIAEGGHRSTNKDFRNFLYIAFGSGAELETHLEIARRQGLADPMQIDAVVDALEGVMKMLNKLIQTYED